MPRTLFWFEIPIGADWHHELPVARDENGHPVDDWTGWSASMIIRDQDDNGVATLNTDGDLEGTITLAAGGLVTLYMHWSETSQLTPTTTYAGGKTRARLFGDLIFSKDSGVKAILAARMSGVVTTTTLLGGA